MRKLPLIVGAAAIVLIPASKPALKHTRAGIIAANIYQDSLRRFHFKSEQIGVADFIPSRTVAQELAHDNTVYATYTSALGGGDARYQGIDALELGPGFNVAVDLRMVAAGAKRVTAADKFVPFVDSPYHRELYRDLRNELGGAERARFDEAIQVGDKLQLNPSRLNYVYGKDPDQLAAAMGPKSVDLIVSNAVLEEIYDLDGCFRAMDRMLRPGGRMVHKIDLSDYRMFEKHGYSPMEFLTVPDPVYRFMVERSGQPNRKRVDYYRAKMAQLGYRSNILITWVYGNEKEFDAPKAQVRYGQDYSGRTLQMIRDVRPRLADPFRRLSDEDLMVRGIILVAEKPAGTSQQAAR